LLLLPTLPPPEEGNSVWVDWVKRFGLPPTQVDHAYVTLTLPQSVKRVQSYPSPEIIFPQEKFLDGKLTIRLTSEQPAKPNEWTAWQDVSVTAHKIGNYWGRHYMDETSSSRLLGDGGYMPGFTWPQLKFLPEARRYWDDISEKSPSDAANYLHGLATVETPQKLFQVDFVASQLFYAAPLFLACVLLYLAAHLRYARKKLRTETTLPVDDVNWIGLFPGFLPSIVLWITIFFLPPLVTIAIVFRLAHPSQDEQYFGRALISRIGAVFFDPPVSSDASENKTVASLSRTFHSVR
jgi:hypothetical protein